GRVAQETQAVDGQGLSPGPAAGSIGGQAAPQGVDHGLGRAVGDVPARHEALGEQVQRPRVHRAGAQRNDLADLEILEVNVQRLGHSSFVLGRSSVQAAGSSDTRTSSLPSWSPVNKRFSEPTAPSRPSSTWTFQWTFPSASHGPISATISLARWA